MTKLNSRFIFTVLLSVILVVPETVARSNDGKGGFSSKEIAEAANVEGKNVGGEILDLRSVLPDPDLGQSGGLVFEILKAHQWRIAFVKYENGHFKLAWLSPLLDDTFERVAANEGLQLVSVRGEPMVQFRGCKAHMCAWVFGVALFRLSDGKPFIVKVARLGGEEIEYSPELFRLENKTYKDWLDDQINPKEE